MWAVLGTFIVLCLGLPNVILMSLLVRHTKHHMALKGFRVINFLVRHLLEGTLT